ncbi:MAG: polysaccharide pyruvyl transferase family protein [Fibrobacterota bacterium]
MIVELRKVSFVNKGGELMLHALKQEVQRRTPDAQFVMSTKFPTSPYGKRASLGFYQKFEYEQNHIEWSFLERFIPASLKEKLGIVPTKKIDAVLDAAGFAYSSQFNSIKTKDLARVAKTCRKNDTKLILMPQAFGPFKSFTIRRAITAAVNRADLIYAREQTSYNYLTEVVGTRSNIRIAPDFTNLVKGTVPDTFDRENNQFCLIPNHHMLDKTPSDVSNAYESFMCTCAKYLVERGQKPFILIHEGRKDELLGESIRRAAGNIPIVKEPDPFKIKGILGQCRGTVGSRFHGLVSALSQGVPSLGTGWSHKYRHLFEDYGFPEGVVDVRMKESDIHTALDQIIDPAQRGPLCEKITENSGHLKEQSRKMWNDIFALLAN